MHNTSMTGAAPPSISSMAMSCSSSAKAIVPATTKVLKNKMHEIATFFDAAYILFCGVKYKWQLLRGTARALLLTATQRAQ